MVEGRALTERFYRSFNPAKQSYFLLLYAESRISTHCFTNIQYRRKRIRKLFGIRRELDTQLRSGESPGAPLGLNIN